MSSKQNSKTSSTNSLKIDVQNQLNEFYKIAKEKLISAKKEVENSKKEYEVQKERNRKKGLQYKDLLDESKELDLRIKGIKEKIIIAKRNESILSSQINLTKTEIANANNEMNLLKLETDNKVKKVKEESSKIKSVKENQVKYIQEKIDREKEINKELLQKIKEVESRINELSNMIQNASVEENNKNNILLNEAAEMTKFLAEL